MILMSFRDFGYEVVSASCSYVIVLGGGVTHLNLWKMLQGEDGEEGPPGEVGQQGPIVYDPVHLHDHSEI